MWFIKNFHIKLTYSPYHCLSSRSRLLCYVALLLGKRQKYLMWHDWSCLVCLHNFTSHLFAFSTPAALALFSSLDSPGTLMPQPLAILLCLPPSLFHQLTSYLIFNSRSVTYAGRRSSLCPFQNCFLCSPSLSPPEFHEASFRTLVYQPWRKYANGGQGDKITETSAKYPA